MAKRQIEKKMIDHLDSLLVSNGLAQQAIKDKNARMVFRLAAQALVGVREVGGNNRGPMVELIQETIGGANREAWCMSFVQTCLAYAEFKTGVSSPIIGSERCTDVWNGTPKSQRVKRYPAPGAIAIWHYPPSDDGHTGIVEHYQVDDAYMNLFEGNTESGLSDAGTIERDGGGVYYTKRSVKSSSKMALRGFLIPF